MSYVFGPEIAMPLKEAIAQTEEVSLGSTIATNSNLGKTLKGVLELDIEMASVPVPVPGESLYVGFKKPTYDLDEINRVIAEIVGRVSVGKTSTFEARLWGPNTIVVNPNTFIPGQIFYTEESPEPIGRNITTVYSVSNPFLRKLLKDIDIEAGQAKSKEHSFKVVRHTWVGFYPSRLFAAFVADLTQYMHVKKPDFPIDHGITMTVEEFEKIARSDDEARTLQEVLTHYHHSSYRPSNRLMETIATLA